MFLFFYAVNMFVFSQTSYLVAENVVTGNVQACARLILPNPPSTVAMSVMVSAINNNASEYLNMRVYYYIKELCFLCMTKKTLY